MAIFLREEDVRQLLTMPLAIAAVREAHLAHALGRAIDVPRQRTRTPLSALHVLQGALLDAQVSGYKAYTTARAGNRFLVHLFDASDGTLSAVVEADFLGMMRTGAAGGIAAQALARPDASVVGVFGTGWQAQGQIEAVCALLPVRRVKVWSRNAERRERFCRQMAERVGREVIPAGGAEDAVRGSDIVVTITASATPVFDGQWLDDGTHINAAGSNALIRREIDEQAVRRAAVVCVDSRATAVREAGDLLPAFEKGRLHEGQLVELGEVLAGQRRGRGADSDVTLFESQGMAIQDLAVATKVVALARERGLGQQLPL